MNYQQVTIPVGDAALQEILIAQLGEIGYEGFEEDPDRLRAYITENDFDPAALEATLQTHSLTWSAAPLENKNWNEEWEKNFQPVRVDDFCVIRASFHIPAPGFEHELVITPKMSFGTGHHATTFMMIQAMRKLVFKGKKVLDFGTGTGVLAILAARLGANEVLAIDNDDWSIDNAIENVHANDTGHIEIRKGGSIPEDGPFDIILANVNKYVILKELANMGQQLARDGVILLSGLLDDDLQGIEKEVLNLKLPISERLSKDNWICLKLKK